MQMMKAAVVKAFGKPLVIEDVPVPTPGPGEVLVKVMACGVCHTDLHAADGDWPVKPTPPFIPGHEAAGVVVALGAGVTDFKLGDAVGVAWLHDACGAASICEHRLGNLCEHQHNTRIQRERRLRRIRDRLGGVRRALPANVDFAPIAPILCAGVTTYKGIERNRSAAGRMGRHFGLGGLGHIAMQYAKAMGLHVAALDIAEDKLALARTSAPTVAINALRTGCSRASARDTGRRRPRRAGDGGLAARVLAGTSNGAPQGHGEPRRAAARRVSQRRSSTSCSSGSRCAARSSAHATTSTRRSLLPSRGR